MNAMVLINPGTGHCGRATLRQAWTNVRAWCREAKMGAPARRPGYDDGEGRYGFVATDWRPSRRRGAPPGTLTGCTHVILMPGISMTTLRGPSSWTDDRGCLRFAPRLYVDGNSWLWKFSFPHDGEDA